MSRRAARSQMLIFMSIFVPRWSAGTGLLAKHVCKPFSRYGMYARITLRESALVEPLLFRATGKTQLGG